MRLSSTVSGCSDHAHSFNARTHKAVDRTRKWSKAVAISGLLRSKNSQMASPGHDPSSSWLARSCGNRAVALSTILVSSCTAFCRYLKEIRISATWVGDLGGA